VAVQQESSASSPLGVLIGSVTAGVVGFGGGSALIPIMDRELVVKRRAVSAPTFTRHAVVATITPGALPVKLAAFVGQAAHGPLVSLAAAMLVALPGVLGTIGFLAAADQLGSTAVQLVTLASVGINLVITVLLLGYIWKVFTHAQHRLKAYLVITVIAAVSTGSKSMVRGAGAFFNAEWESPLPTINAVQLIVIALVAIAAWGWVKRADQTAGTSEASPRERPSPWLVPLFVAVALLGGAVFLVHSGVEGLSFAGLLALSTVTSFGGGEAYVGVADGFFVQSGLVDQSVFYTQLVPAANALPGPILVKLGAGMGYLHGAAQGPAQAWLLALAAAAITIGACCAVAIPVLRGYERVQHHPVAKAISFYILPVISGLLISVCATMLDVSAQVISSTGHQPALWLWVSLPLIAGMLYLHLSHRVPDLALLAATGAASMIALSL
jgi:chromate transporter